MSRGWGVVAEVGAVALGAHPAQIEHAHVVRDRHALAHVLVDPDHGDAGLGQGLDDVVDLTRQARRDHRRRLVEQDRARLERERAAEFEEPLLAAAHAAGRLVAALLEQREMGAGDLQRLGHAPLVVAEHPAT